MKRAAKAPRPVKQTKSAPVSRKRPGLKLPPPETIVPQLATLVERAPQGEHWVWEVKYDGYRALAHIEEGAAHIYTRNGKDWTETFAPIAETLAGPPAVGSVLDGEICYVLSDGRTDIQHLQNALHDSQAKARAADRLAYYVFDLLFEAGEDLRSLALRERKTRLRKLLQGPKLPRIVYGDHLGGDGADALRQACALQLEGIVGKRADRPYRAGRSLDWIKLKCSKRQEFVIVGMTPPKGAREGLGALLLGLQQADGLRYAGRVGTGFSQRSLRELAQRLAPLVIDRPQLNNAPRGKNLTWVRPLLVCEVRFTEFTREGILRHPSFAGLREDKPAAQVGTERPARVPATVSARKSGRVEVCGVSISNPQRVLDQASGTTKLELARYHEQVGDWLLPYARKRPLALVRCPQGDAQKCFFQKHAAPGFGRAIGRAKAGKQQVLYVNRTRGVIELVQFGVVELHGWGAPLPKADRPDWVIFDLDPDTALPFARVVEAAQELRASLAALDLVSFVKTTGGKGLHVVVPLRGRQNWTEVRQFSERVARACAEHAPQRYVASMSKRQREGRIFIDYLRNGAGATAILPYSPRARPGATVALPVAWKDLAHLDPREFTVASVPRLLARRRTDPWAEFEASRRDLRAP